MFHAEVDVIPEEILFDFEPSEFLTWDQVEYDLSPELKAQSKSALYQKQNKGKLQVSTQVFTYQTFCRTRFSAKVVK